MLNSENTKYMMTSKSVTCNTHVTVYLHENAQNLGILNPIIN